MGSRTDLPCDRQTGGTHHCLVTIPISSSPKIRAPRQPGRDRSVKGGGSKSASNMQRPRNARDYPSPELFDNAESPALVATVWIAQARLLIRRLLGRALLGGSHECAGSKR